MRFQRCGLSVVIMLLAGSTFAHAQTAIQMAAPEGPAGVPALLSNLADPSELIPDVAADASIADANEERPADDGIRATRLTEWRHKFSTWRRTSGALFPLYASYAALQIVDVHSTNRALDRGGVEANVLMRGIAGSPLPLTLVKASAAASTIYLVERVRRRSRMGAMLTMVGLDSAYAIVVAANYHR